MESIMSDNTFLHDERIAAWEIARRFNGLTDILRTGAAGGVAAALATGTAAAACDGVEATFSLDDDMAMGGIAGSVATLFSKGGGLGVCVTEGSGEASSVVGGGGGSQRVNRARSNPGGTNQALASGSHSAPSPLTRNF
ncbi:hypothetical protein H257_06597 [Aphanomyces astaci]|uniref:Uncharacterized protein n=1 Tax=Aphanomyces astaci TaxID=112090 RepID=W4GLL4_APHAT|nr:hypothetical protein H257_06597 [Aphanomyces astaci]ETV80256.1 hypothetical protein H257_06597 [Aphanomyces astaci]|eukprot:XP_009830180.1 hypothetical protein H257_06597 [Aphanomyces astaci]